MSQAHKCPQLSEYVHDARRFVLFSRQTIEQAPLQIYSSALVFAPTMSVIRQQYKSCIPRWITQLPKVGDNWNALVQTLEGHSSLVHSVAFSHDSARLASASADKTVKIWDASSGECLQTLEGHSDSVISVAFSHDSARLASASHDKTVKIWDASSGECLQTLEGHSDWVNSVAFSHDSARLASASQDETVKIWDASSGEGLRTLEVHSDVLYNISFDPTGSYLHTVIGAIALGASSSSSSNQTTNIVDPRSPRYQSWALSSDGEWITYNSENWVWIPSEYRPFCSAVSRETIGVGLRGGKVWMCSFRVDNI